jgi:tetratricopeptide (TPR) repeat protein
VNLNKSFSRLLFAVAVIAAVVARPMYAIQETGPSKAAMAAGPAYMRKLETAASAYSIRDFKQALDDLEEADQIHANIPDTWNMRGAIYAEEQQYDLAREAFEKASKLNPGDFWPPYNIAQLLLFEKKYADAADEFKSLEVYHGHEELVQFKIVFAELLAGNDGAAKEELDSMKFPCDTPGYYFAHAAWSYAHKDEKEGAYYVRASVKVFGDQGSSTYYDSLAGLGWVRARNKDGTIPVQQAAPSMTLPTGPLEPDGGQ